MPHRTRELLVVGLLALVSCQNPFAVSDCPDQVQITVSVGTTPEIDWTPRCRVHGLHLWTPWGNTTVWSIHGPPQYLICSDDGGGCNTALNTLYPPLRYGDLPRDAYQDVPHPGEEVPPLLAGWPYVVRLDRANAGTSGGFWPAVDTFVVIVPADTTAP